MLLAHISKVKLLKLSLKTFDGDITQWSMFCDTFQSSVDSNHELSNIDKFNYLQSLLEGPAFAVVSGLKLTACNYVEEWFGNKQQIID